MSALSKMTIDELHAENARLMAERGEAERGFKKQQTAIQRELNRRAVTARIEAMSEAEKAELRAALGGGK